jgi:hypothetical protein
VYEDLKDRYSTPGKPLPLGTLILMASVSGWYASELTDLMTGLAGQLEIQQMS